MQFEFTEDGKVYRVSTEVGSGLAKVVVEEINPPAQPALEPSEE